MRRMLAAAMLALALPTAALADAPVAGTVLAGAIQQDLNTKTAQVGQPVTLFDVASSDGGATVSGARMLGTVTEVVKAGMNKPAQLKISFTKLKLADGTIYPINGVVTGIKEQTKSNTTKEVLGGAAGMAVGNIIGKKLGVPLGGLIGAAGGFLIAKSSKEDMTVTKGTTVTVQLNAPRPQAQ